MLYGHFSRCEGQIQSGMSDKICIEADFVRCIPHLGYLV